MAPLIPKFGTRRGGGCLNSRPPAALPSPPTEKDRDTNCTEGLSGPHSRSELFWKTERSLPTAGIQTPDSPSRG